MVANLSDFAAWLRRATARPYCLRLKAGLTVDVEALRVLALAWPGGAR